MTAGVLSGWFSSGVALIDRFGPYGWFTAALVGALCAAAIFALVGYSKKRFAEAKLINRVSADRPTDAINPLEKDFHRQRISIKDIAHPLTRTVAGKEFTDCELVGPANIFFLRNCHLNGVGFGNCEFILTKTELVLNNVIPFQDVSIRGGDILSVTVFVHPSNFDQIKSVPGITFLNQTGDEEVDSR
ncbi:hypothetical protein [Pseudopontixanthobacter vadosimaris]|uniref:hypothetical protein n=1 Tax=Pseudopontixanthobacter vadosimaris TaxID=2726450 RepID=UPI0014755BD8|nr:hypothetical protein [Pseudopontixanthobacter vadosimaris]